MKKYLNLINLPTIETIEIIKADNFISLFLGKYYEQLEFDPTVSQGSDIINRIYQLKFKKTLFNIIYVMSRNII